MDQDKIIRKLQADVRSLKQSVKALGARSDSAPKDHQAKLPAFQIDTKRFYMPGFKLGNICPECGAQVAYDLEHQHLSYPKANEPMEFCFYCESCEHEWIQNILLTVYLELL